MKQKKSMAIILFLLIVIGLGFLISPYLIEKFSYANTKSVNLSNLNVDGIKIGDNLTKAIPKPSNKQKDSWYKTNLFKVRATENRIDMIVIEGSNQKVLINSKKHMSLSSSNKEIRNILGDDFYKRSDNQGFSIRGFRDKKAKVDLEFWYLNKKLEKIQVSKEGAQS